MGEENEPYSSSVVCQKADADKQYSLVYQRMPPVPAASAATPVGGAAAAPRPLMEVLIANHLSKCAVEFGVFVAAPPSEQKTVHWVSSLIPSDLVNVTHLRIAMADASGPLFPIYIAKRKI